MNTGFQHWARRTGGRAIGAYMALIDSTTRWTYHGRDHVAPYWREGRPLIMAVWHGRLMQMHKCWPRHGFHPAHVLISQSREGEIVAAATAQIGYRVIRGSTAKKGKDKGGMAALREMLRRLEEGHCIGVTPDGPKGPRMRLTPGLIQLAKLSGAPIAPCAWSIRPAKVFQSWDRFMLPAPFGRGVFVWGAPIAIARDAELEAARLQLEAALNRATAQADALIGRAPIEPAPAPAQSAPEAA